MIDFRDKKYSYHLTDEDIKRINKPLLEYEEKLKLRKRGRVYIYGIFFLIVIVAFILWREYNIKPFPFIPDSPFAKRQYIISENIELKGGVVKIRISRFDEKNLLIISEYNGKAEVAISFKMGERIFESKLSLERNVDSKIIPILENKLSIVSGEKLLVIDNVESLNILK